MRREVAVDEAGDLDAPESLEQIPRTEQSNTGPVPTRTGRSARRKE